MDRNSTTELTYESMLTDPMIRLVMDADGVNVDDFIIVMSAAAARQLSFGHGPLTQGADRAGLDADRGTALLYCSRTAGPRRALPATLTRRGMRTAVAEGPQVRAGDRGS